MLERNPSHRILKKRLETIASWKDFRMSFLTMILDLNLHLLKSLRIKQFIFDKSDFFYFIRRQNTNEKRSLQWDFRKNKSKILFKRVQFKVFGQNPTTHEFLLCCIKFSFLILWILHCRRAIVLFHPRVIFYY